MCVLMRFCNYVFLQGRELTPLHFASYYNQIDVLELLIQHGAQLDVRDKVSFCDSDTTIVLPTHNIIMQDLVLSNCSKLALIV